MQQKKKESNENNIKTRQQPGWDKTVLLLEIWKQVKSTLYCSCQSTGTVINPMPPPLLSSIAWTRRLSSANASVVFIVVFVLIFLLWRLHRRRRLLGPFVYPLPPPSLSLIPQILCIFVVLCRRVRRSCWVVKPILLCQRRRRRRQYSDPINTPAPP